MSSSRSLAEKDCPKTKDSIRLDECIVKAALEKLFAREGVKVWARRKKYPFPESPPKSRRMPTRRLGWTWKAKKTNGKKTFNICFLGANGWSSWIEEKTGESKWLAAVGAIAKAGGYVLFPTGKAAAKSPLKAKFVEMPRNILEILVMGDLA